MEVLEQVLKKRKYFDVAEVTHDTPAAPGKCMWWVGVGSLRFQVSMGLRAGSSVRVGEKEEEIMPLLSWASVCPSIKWDVGGWTRTVPPCSNIPDCEP